MQVILELQTGEEQGRRIRLGVRQALEVGRSAWADFAVPDDGKLAEHQFRLENDGRACRLTNLDKESGVSVNGQPVQRTQLRHGDVILAGNSRFRIQIEGEVALAVGEEPLAEAPVLDSRPRAGQSLVGKAVEQLTGSGLYILEGQTAEMAPAQLARGVVSKVPLHLLIDFRRLEHEPPDNVGEGNYLFDWFGETASSSSPLFIGGTQIRDSYTLIEQAWGRDALVCFFARKSEPEVLTNLRRLVRPSKDQMLGLCWPRVLGEILKHSRGELPKQFFADIEAVLIEGESAEQWQIFSATPFGKYLLPLGLEIVPASAVAEAAS